MNSCNKKEIVSLLKITDNILILPHKNPDGDSMGSALALCAALRKIGKKANVFTDHDINNKIKWLLNEYQEQSFKPEFIITVDVSDEKLLPILDLDYKIDLCIDHHQTNKILATKKYVEIESAATGEIIFDLITKLNVPMDVLIAKYLYVAIATDTGCFRYANTTKTSHYIAAKLMEFDLNYAEINEMFFEFESIKDFKLKKKVLNEIEFFFDGNLAITEISQATLKELDMSEEEINVALNSESIKIEKVNIGILIKEKQDGVKVSFRTSFEFNAAEIAAIWGGGGHKRAAGCFIPSSLNLARQEIIKKLEKWFV